MKKELHAAFKPLLDKMKDEKLKEKVVDTWALCAERGGWKTYGELEEMPFTLLTNTLGVNLIEHTIAVTKGAMGLADAMFSTYKKVNFDINMDILIAGGILHDVGKLLETEKTADGKYRKSYHGKIARHPVSGAIVAAELGLPLEVQNIIICHAKEGDGAPKRIEAVFVHQADFATFDPCVMKEKGLLIEGN